MKKELREKIIAYNKRVKEEHDKVDDLTVIINALMQMPWGQLKKVLTEDIIKILEKHGFKHE